VELKGCPVQVFVADFCHFLLRLDCFLPQLAHLLHHKCQFAAWSSSSSANVIDETKQAVPSKLSPAGRAPGRLSRLMRAQDPGLAGTPASLPLAEPRTRGDPPIAVAAIEIRN
jgi:hypothetical protein